MEILDVSLSPKVVKINDPFRLALSVIGAEAEVEPGFKFPFTNNSLTDPLLEFISLESQGLLPTPMPVKTLYFTGAMQKPEFTSYHPDYYIIEGTTEAIAPGEYFLYFTPKNPYTWIDGGAETKMVAWSISADEPPAESEEQWFYGYDLINSNSDPAARVIYPEDVDNTGFEPALMGSTFSYGDWPSKAGDKFMPRPCMLSFAGEVLEYLDQDDYTKTIDGGDSHVATSSFGANAMMKWGKIWTKRWESDGIYHFRCSNKQVDPDYECWCNYDQKNNQIPNFYTPIYFGSKDSSNRLRSISGATNSVSTTADTEVQYATANGDGWYIEVAADRFLIQDLLVMMFKNTNLQAVLGRGRTGQSSAIKPGTMDTYGLFWGSTTSGANGVKVFGMENWWGNIYRRTAGYVYTVNQQFLKITRGTKDGTLASDYNTIGSGYIPLEDSKISANSYISGMRTESWGRIPITASGSASTYEADYVYRGTSTNASVVYYAFYGGYYSGTYSYCGPFYVRLYYEASASYSYAGAALSCKPSLKE